MIPAKNTSAFSLVEVVLALGVGGFVLTSLLGLLLVSLSSSSASTDDTVVATMASSILNDTRALHFADLTPKSPPLDQTPIHAITDANVLPGTSDVPKGSVPAVATPNQEAYFDSSGARLKYQSGANTGKDMTKTDALAAGAVYQCIQSLQGDANTLGTCGSDGTATMQEVNLLNVTLTFSWPIRAPSPPNKSVINATVARY